MLSGHVKAIYYVLTGELIVDEIPLPEPNLPIDKRSNLSPEVSFTISPNPTFGNINVDTQSDKEYLLEILNIEGLIIRKESLKSKVNLDMTNEINGIYIVIIRDVDSNEIVTTRRIVKN